jgi:hypothetical protein
VRRPAKNHQYRVTRRSEGTNEIEDGTSETTKLSNDTSSLDIDNANGKVVACHSQQSVLAVQDDGGDVGGQDDRFSESHCLEVEQLHSYRQYHSQSKGREETYVNATLESRNDQNAIQSIRRYTRDVSSLRIVRSPRRHVEHLALESRLQVVRDPTSPKFPHAVTAVVCILIPSVPISSCENETLTVTTPSVLSVHLPILFPSTLQLLPIDSPSWYVTTSSQSLDLAVENAMDLITGNLRDESETPRLEAFFAIDPVRPRQLHTLTEERGIPTLTELITTRVSYDRDVSQSTIFSSRQESLAIFSIVPHEADRRTVSGPLFEKSSRCSRRVEYPLLQRHISTAVK